MSPTMTSLPRRIPLALLPTPLERLDRLSAAWGGPTIWVKRDDLTGFGLSGNKVRKLEYHLAAARDAGADTLVTTGALQSNHCRATALAAARVGFGCVLALRTPDGGPPSRLEGNHMLDLLAGAEVRYVTPEEYDRREDVLATIASELQSAGRSTWVIPEGASDALGMWGFVAAMAELEEQLVGAGPVAAVWHAASSGGTTAGLGWATDRMSLDSPIVGCSIGDTVPDLRRRIERIWAEEITSSGGSWPAPHLELNDDHVGRGYGLTTVEELEIQAEASRLTGLIFDPTYTGKAIVGLRREIAAGRYGPGETVVFWHTGGGFAVFSHDFGTVLGS
jgi:D-cysteine desulfhydrase